VSETSRRHSRQGSPKVKRVLVCSVPAAVTSENFLAQTSLIATSILSCVAFEYGQIFSAWATSSFATLRSKPGMVTISRAVRE
jgi:hypothetical protein